MLLKEFYEPEWDDTEAPSFEALAGMIEDHCPIILNFYRETKKSLFRGLQSKKFFLDLTPPVNRPPKDSGSWLHNLTVKQLDAAGFTANRNNSFFCSGDFKQTLPYGTTYIVFPYNTFQYTWSTKIIDWFGHWDTINPNPSKLTPEEFEDVYGFRAGNNRTLDDLDKAISSKHEIMIHGKCIFIRQSTYDLELKKFLK